MVAVLGLLFAVFAGEYSVLDWMDMRARVAEEQQALDVLRAEVDSLTRLADELETDTELLEREARERFGMIRDGETMFRISPAPADTSP